LKRSDEDAAEMLEANADLVKRKDDEAKNLYYNFRKQTYQRATKQKLEELQREYSEGGYFDINAEKENIVANEYRENPYPEFMSCIGHAFSLHYLGTENKFQIVKYFYPSASKYGRQNSNSNSDKKNEVRNYQFNMPLKAIPSLILSLENLMAFVKDKLILEGQKPDLLNCVPKTEPEFVDDDIKKFTPDHTRSYN